MSPRWSFISPSGRRPKAWGWYEWPPRWYPVTQEEAGFNLFVAIPLKNGDLWNSLSTSWPTSWFMLITPGWYEYKPGCGLGYRICQLVSFFDLQPNQATMMSITLGGIPVWLITVVIPRTSLQLLHWDRMVAQPYWLEIVITSPVIPNKRLKGHINSCFILVGAHHCGILMDVLRWLTCSSTHQ